MCSWAVVTLFLGLYWQLECTHFCIPFEPKLNYNVGAWAGRQAGVRVVGWVGWVGRRVSGWVGGEGREGEPTSKLLVLDLFAGSWVAVRFWGPSCPAEGHPLPGWIWTVSLQGIAAHRVLWFSFLGFAR